MSSDDEPDGDGTDERGDGGVQLAAADPFQRIQALVGVGRADLAGRIVADWIAATPDAADAHLARAIVLSAQDAHAEALVAVEESLRRAPDHDVALRFRGVVLFALGRFREAEESVRAALALDPAWPPHHTLYARLLSACDKDAAALARAEHALRLAPDEPALHTLRAELLRHVPVRDWSVHEDAARTAVRLDPADPDAHAVLGMVLLQRGARAEAEERLRAALALDPTHKLALLGLSHALVAKKPWYRPLFALETLLARFGPEGRLGAVFGLWALYRATALALPKSAGDLVSILYLAFCAYTWFAEPITRALLRRHYPWLT